MARLLFFSGARSWPDPSTRRTDRCMSAGLFSSCPPALRHRIPRNRVTCGRTSMARWIGPWRVSESLEGPSSHVTGTCAPSSYCGERRRHKYLKTNSPVTSSSGVSGRATRVPNGCSRSWRGGASVRAESGSASCRRLQRVVRDAEADGSPRTYSTTDSARCRSTRPTSRCKRQATGSAAVPMSFSARPRPSLSSGARGSCGSIGR